MPFRLPDYRKWRGSGRRTPKPLKATSTDKLRERIRHVVIRREGEQFVLYATDSYVFIKLPIDGVPEEGVEIEEVVIPREAMEHIQRGVGFDIRKDPEEVVQVGPITVYKNTVAHIEFPSWEKVAPKKSKKPLRIGFNPELLKNAADALGCEGMEVEIDLDDLDQLRSGQTYLKALRLRPLNEPEGGREALQMPIRLEA